MRDKSRDLFDFGSLLEHNVLSEKEIIELFSKMDSKIKSTNDIINFIKYKKVPIDDESVYLNEKERIDLDFKEIKSQVNESLKKLKHFTNL